MATITIDLPDELADQLAALRDRLPELLMLSMQQPALPASVYRSLVTFLAGAPTPAEIAAFRPPPAVQERVATLLARSHAGDLTPNERAELDEFERIEHLVVLIKAGNLPSLLRAA